MNKFVMIVLIVICSIALSIFPTNPAKANRSIVVPNDYPTISLAIENAVEGDTIFVKKGVYNERITINKALSLIGEDKDTTSINGNKTGTVVLLRHDNVTFTGFTIIYDSSPYTPQSIWMWSTRLAGIHVLSVKNCNISDNIISDCGAGIWLYDAHQNNISNNNVFNNDYGIRIESSTNNYVSDNTVNRNWGGIRLLSTSNNKLSENKISNNAQNFGISNLYLATSADEVDSTNSLDNKPIYYWIGVSNTNIPLDAAYVVLINCTNINVQGLKLSNNQEGIIFAGTINSTISNNNISGCTTGIMVFYSLLDKIIENDLNCYSGIIANGTGTQIIKNTVSAKSIGISTEGSFQTVTENSVHINEWQGNMLKISGSLTNITKNTLIGTSYAYTIIDGSENIFYDNIIKDSYGLRVTSNQNIITRNNVTGGSISVSGLNNTVCVNRINNGFGLTVAGHNNWYFANQVQDNTIGADTGGLESYSSNNLIFQNNFIANKDQIKNYDNEGNFWDNGNSGNYWSDYNGTDINGDGIGEQPYFIMGLALADRGLVPIVTGKDNYPLIAPFDISSIHIQLPQWELNFTIPPPSPSPTASTTEIPKPSLTTTPTPITTPTPYTNPFPTISPTPSPTIPEFPIWTIVTLILSTTLSIIYKRRMSKNPK